VLVEYSKTKVIIIFKEGKKKKKNRGRNWPWPCQITLNYYIFDNEQEKY